MHIIVSGINECMYAYINVHICIYIRMYICIYIRVQYVYLIPLWLLHRRQDNQSILHKL